MTLPSGYIEITAIQTSDTQYIDTGITYDYTKTIVLNIDVQDTVTSKSGSTIMGGYASYAGTWIGAADTYYSCGGGNTAPVTRNTRAIVTGSWYHNVLTFSVNGTYVAQRNCSSLNLNLLFGSYNTNYPCSSIFYGATVYVDNVLTRNLVPCIRMSDDSIGMYDTVNDTFYGNSGTGIFIPVGYTDTYQEVEYVESSGSAYLDTGYIPSNNTVIEVKGNFLNNSGTSLFGANPYLVLTSISGGTPFVFRWNGGSINYGTYDQNTHIFKFDENVAYLDGELAATFASATWTADYSIILFGRNSSSGTVEECVASRIYYCKIWENDVLIHNFVPVRGKVCYTNVGMYDTVTSTFYSNAGSGTFTAGPDVKNNTIQIYTSDGWVDGTPYVYTSNGWVEADTVYVYTENGWVEKD